MHSASLSPLYDAARTRAGLLARTHGLIVVSGRDRGSYLQGLLTNDTVALAPGQGCYAAYLTPQGRMISDLYVYELGDVMVLVLPVATKDTVLSKLDQFIFSEDVQLGDVSSSTASLALIGPDAARLLSPLVGVDEAELREWPLHGNRRVDVDGQPVILLRVGDTGEPGYEMLASAEHLVGLARVLRDAGAAELDASTAEALRIEAGVPVFGQDMDDTTIPLEAGIETRAISFTKGCYVGQEVIVRVLHRGHGRVARKLVGLVFAPGVPVPPKGVALQSGDAAVGHVTSSALSPALARPVALAYVKREVVEAGAQVTTADGLPADIVPLPFVTRS